MGLDTSHDCWHGSYSAFNRLRNAIARAAGWPMTEDSTDYVLPVEFPDEAYMGEWDRVPGDDPLLVFLAHSDCDGVIHPEHGVHIARRLRELALKLPEGADGHIRNGYRAAALQFAAGLEAAAESSEDVVFA